MTDKQHKNDPQSHQTSQSAASAVKVGDKVHYTGPDGRQHAATVDEVEGTQLSLTAMIDGNQQKLTTVPHSADHTAHTWDHHAASGNQGQSTGYTLPDKGY